MKKWKHCKRLLALVLTGTMLFLTACGGGTGGEGSGSGGSGSGGNQSAPAQESGSAGEGEGQSQGKDLSWLNSSDTLPLVKEGTEKKLSLYIQMSPESPDPEKLWLYKFIEDAMNIDIEVTKFTWQNRNEMIPLLFTDGNELPDLIIGAGFSAEELVNYGATEGQLIDLAPYLNETYMPHLTKIYTEHPEYLSAIRDGEGHIWSTGYITDPGECQVVSRAFMNYDWLEQCGKEVPQTLDELLDVLRAFKKMNPDCYPLGGSYMTNNPMIYIMNAFGYLTMDASGLSIALRDGKVVLPAADREAYGAFLTFMHTLYEEELIHPDFFTMDQSTTDTFMVEGRNGFIAQAPFLYTDDYEAWWGVMPLTSEYNDTAQWPINLGALSCGSGVVTTACEEPELAATFLDWFYTFHNLLLSTVGPNNEWDTEYLYDVAGWSFDDQMNQVHADLKGYNSVAEYIPQVIQLWGYSTLGIDIYDGSLEEYDKNPLTSWMPDEYAATLEDTSVLRHDETYCQSGQFHYMMSQKYTLCYHLATEGFPGQVYFDAETATTVTNLGVLLSDYSKAETAKFITGARPLEELDDYFDEMDRLGATELLKYYDDYYQAMK